MVPFFANGAVNPRTTAGPPAAMWLGNNDNRIGPWTVDNATTWIDAGEESVDLRSTADAV